VYMLPASRMHRVRVEMPPDEAGDVLTVKHLAKEVCIETGVDLWNQVLTFRGWHTYKFHPIEDGVLKIHDLKTMSKV